MSDSDNSVDSRNRDNTLVIKTVFKDDGRWYQVCENNAVLDSFRYLSDAEDFASFTIASRKEMF